MTGTDTAAAGTDAVSVIKDVYPKDPFRIYIYAAVAVILLLMVYKIVRFH